MKLLQGAGYKKLTNFTLAFVLAVSSLTAVVPFVFSKEAGAAPMTVGTLSELQGALASPLVDTVTLSADIETSVKLVLTRNNVTVDGAGHSITFTGDDKTAGAWAGNYVLQVYGATGVTLNDITLTNGDAGLFVNRSSVTLTGTVDVSGNQFGGIEVSNGSPLLTVSGTLQNDETADRPSIWTDVTPSATVAFGAAYSSEHQKSGQTWLFQNPILAGAVINETQKIGYADLSAAIAAAAEGDSLYLNADLDLTAMPIINKSLTLDGKGHTLNALYSYTANGVDNAVVLIDADNVTVNNLTTTNASAGEKPHGVVVHGATGVVLEGLSLLNGRAGLIVNGSVVEARNIHTNGNSLYGINVDKPGAALTIGGTNTHGEAIALFVEDPSIALVNDVDGQYVKTVGADGRVAYVPKTEETTTPPSTGGEGTTDDDVIIEGEDNPQPAGPAVTLLGATPIFTSPAAILGVSTGTGDNISGVSGDDAGVKGVNTLTSPAQAADVDDASDGTLWGLAWYWWVLIAAALAALIGWLVRVVRGRAEA